MCLLRLWFNKCPAATAHKKQFQAINKAEQSYGENIEFISHVWKVLWLMTWFSGRTQVIVIYCQHAGSHNMTRLYDRSLGNINKQETLRQLQRQNRVLSIDTEFSDYQSNHLKTILNEALCWRHNFFLSHKSFDCFQNILYLYTECRNAKKCDSYFLNYLLFSNIGYEVALNLALSTNSWSTEKTTKHYFSMLIFTKNCSNQKCFLLMANVRKTLYLANTVVYKKSLIHF